MRFPRTLQEFQAMFPNEDACFEALRRSRWPRGFVCPRCGETASSWISTRRLEQCSRCRYQCSVTAGTVFHRTRVPLLTWFWAIFFLARHKKGISALQLQRDTGVGSYQTAWTMLHKLRSALSHRPAHRLAGLTCSATWMSSSIASIGAGARASCLASSSAAPPTASPAPTTVW